MKLTVRTQVLIWMCALTTIAYFQRNLGVAESTVRQQIGVDIDQMGPAQSCFFWSYALFQVPGGWICQRWGPRAGMAIFCLTWSLATGLTGFTNELWGLCVIRLLVGLGQAAALPCMADVLATWFPSTLRGRATAWVTALMQFGALLNALVTGWLLQQGYSLQTYFLILGLPGILWSLGFYCWYRNQPEEFTGISQAELAELPTPHQQRATTGTFTWSKLLTSPVLWLISTQQFFRAAGYIFFATWFATYLQDVRNFSKQESGIATGCTFAGVLVGTLFGGVISDWILIRTGSVRWARQGVAIAALALCAACVTGFFFVRGETRLINIIAVGLITLATTFSGIAGPAAYTVTIEISGKHVPTVFGCMNMAGNLGAGLLAELTPRLLGPSKNQWDTVIIVVISLYLLSALFWALLNPNHTVFGTDDDGRE